MKSINNKARELDVRNIMQGMEEFATFMSFQGTNSSLRIISVESVSSVPTQSAPKQCAQIIELSAHQHHVNASTQHAVHKSLSFNNGRTAIN